MCVCTVWRESSQRALKSKGGKKEGEYYVFRECEERQ